MQSIDSRDCPIEIIVAESGFIDGIPEIVQSFPDIKIISSASGRGEQIRAGIKATINDVVVLLPAESRLIAGAIPRMMRALQENDSAVGGCLGAAYDDLQPGWRLKRFTPVLNRIWVLASGISVGDQAKFFRREAIQKPFPAIDLLADIEISLCMKEKGAMVFIPDGVTGSARSRDPAGKWTDYIKTIYVTMRYLTLRRLGFLGCGSADCHHAVPTDPAKKQAA